MAQSDIFDLLKSRRLSGDESFFTATEIRKLLKDRNIIVELPSLHENLKKLRRFGFIEYNIRERKGMAPYNNYYYRLKKEYL